MDVLIERQTAAYPRAVKKTFKKETIVFFRKLAFVLFSLVLRWPIWGMLFFISRLVRIFDYLFLVYPGSDSDLDGYCPRWLANSFLFREKPVIGGIISKGKAGRGLVLVVPNKPFEFGQKPIAQKITKRLELVRKITRAKSIALAGQAPGLVKKTIGLNPPFVEGVKGTVFCIVETLKEVSKREKIHRNAEIVVVGVGRIGQAVIDYLREQKISVTGIDIIRTKKGVVLAGKASEILSQAKVVIVLTPKGSDFLPYVKHLKPSAIVIDDTHPKMRKKISQAVYKVAVELPGTSFYPRLPGYKKNWIPGCAVEAIVEAANGKGSVSKNSQIEFNKRARKLGFKPILIKNKKGF